MEERGGERGRGGEGRGIKTTWVPGFRLLVFLFFCKSSTGFVHLIITSTTESIVCTVFGVAPSFYFYSPRVIHPTESLRQSSLNIKANMSDWSAPASGTPCWISIPAAEVARGRCQLLSFLPRFACSAAARSYLLHLTSLPPLPHSPLPQPLLTNRVAKQFYSTVFNWEFMPQETQSSAYPPDRIAFFSPPDKKRSPGGAISKVDGDTRITKVSGGNAMLYLMVDDLGEYMKVSLSSVYPKAMVLFKTEHVSLRGRWLI
jgi:hypothetical protein